MSSKFKIITRGRAPRDSLGWLLGVLVIIIVCIYSTYFFYYNNYTIQEAHNYTEDGFNVTQKSDTPIFNAARHWVKVFLINYWQQKGLSVYKSFTHYFMHIHEYRRRASRIA